MRAPSSTELAAAALGALALLGAAGSAWTYRRALAADDRARTAESRLAGARREAAAETRGRLAAQAAARARVPGEGIYALASAVRALRLAEREGVGLGSVRGTLHRALLDALHSLPLEGHRAPLTALDLSPDGRRAVTASEDKTARVWDLATGLPVATLAGHDHTVSAARFVDGGARVVTVESGGRARLWDAATGAAIAAPAAPAATEEVPAGPWSSLAPTAVRRSADGRRAVVLARGVATLWDVDGHAPRATLAGHAEPVADVSLSADGRLALTASLDATARVWDFASGALIRTLEGHRAELSLARFTPDGRTAVTVGADRAARVWTLGGTALGYALRHPAGGALRAARFSPDGARLLTVGDPCLVWETETGRLVATLATGAHTDDADFTVDGAAVLARGPDGVRIVRADGGSELARVPTPARDAWRSGDGRRLLVAGADGVARLHDAADGRLLAALGGAEGELAGAAFLGATGLVLVARTRGDPGLWRATDGGLERTLEGHGGPVRAVAASSNGRYVLTASELGARLWNASSGLRFGVIDEHPGGVTRARFSRDGARVVTVGTDGSARLWAVDTVEREVLLQNGEQPIVDAELAADGGRAVTLTRWGTVQPWSRPHRALGRPVGGHRHRIDVVRLAPDAATFATASTDRTARLYDASNGEGLAAFEGHDRAVVDVRYSPDGRRLATVGDDGVVRVWAVDVGEWIALACALLPTTRNWSVDRPLHEYCAAHRGPAGLRPVGW